MPVGGRSEPGAYKTTTTTRVVSGRAGTVAGANVQRELVRGITGFASVENIY